MREENIDKMNFKELRSEVQYLRDELAILTRKFNDAIYNLDSDNFGKSFTVAQDNMKAQIKINAQEIATKVSEDDLTDKLSSYSTINQTASAISSAVTTINNNLTTNYSTITQTADKIRSVVAKDSFEDEAEEVSYISQFEDQEKIYVIREYVSDTNYIASETYYFYNGTEWEALKGTDLYTCFEQTANGFKLKGDVSIDGNVISNASITGGEIRGGKFLSTVDENYRENQLMMTSTSFDLLSFRDVSGSPSLLSYYSIRYTPISNNSVSVDFNSVSVDFNAAGQDFLNVEKYTASNPNVAKVSPKGVWDFDGCQGIIWGQYAPTAVFG